MFITPQDIVIEESKTTFDHKMKGTQHNGYWSTLCINSETQRNANSVGGRWGGGVIVYRQESEGHIKLWLVSQSYKAGTNDFHCVYRSSLALFMASSSVALRLMSAS
jgi:hypothetical protein